MKLIETACIMLLLVLLFSSCFQVYEHMMKYACAIQQHKKIYACVNTVYEKATETAVKGAVKGEDLKVWLEKAEKTLQIENAVYENLTGGREGDTVLSYSFSILNERYTILFEIKGGYSK